MQNSHGSASEINALEAQAYQAARSGRDAEVMRLWNRILVIDPNHAASDFGWPDCPGDTACADVVGPLGIFPVASTPTGVAAIGHDVYVSLRDRGISFDRNARTAEG